MYVFFVISISVNKKDETTLFSTLAHKKSIKTVMSNS